MSKPPSKVTQDQVNAAAWKACNTFRGPIDPTQYKDYILVMLFLKYISDTHKANRAELMEKYGDDTVRLVRALERDDRHAECSGDGRAVGVGEGTYLPEAPHGIDALRFGAGRGEAAPGFEALYD
jgi:hypothetical protein